jgi:hypothetical protein
LAETDSLGGELEAGLFEGVLGFSPWLSELLLGSEVSSLLSLEDLLFGVVEADDEDEMGLDS